MPPRTMLPPNLTRHYHEALRRRLKAAGETVTPWFALPMSDRAAFEGEIDTFREAIRAAEEEQNLLASLDATPAPVAADTAAQAPAQPSQAAPAASGDCDCPRCTASKAEAAAARECGCPGCTAVAILMQLLDGASLEAVMGADFGKSSDDSVVVLQVKPAKPLTGDGRTPLEQAARKAIADWFAKNPQLLEIDQSTIAPLTSFDSPPMSLADLERALERQQQEERRRVEFLEWWRTGRQMVTESPKVRPLTREDVERVKEQVLRESYRSPWPRF